MVADKLVTGTLQQAEVVTAGDGKELKVFKEEPSLLGRQLEHSLLAFTQAQFLIPTTYYTTKSVLIYFDVDEMVSTVNESTIRSAVNCW